MNWPLRGTAVQRLMPPPAPGQRDAAAQRPSLFVVSLRFPKTIPMAPVKAAPAKLFCICLAGFGLPGSPAEYKVIRKPSVWQQARWGGRCVWV